MEEFGAEPPLPGHIYRAELDKLLDSKYNFGVYETARKVVGRLVKHFVRPTADASAQTQSLKQLTLKYEDEIRELESDLALLQEEYERTKKDARRLGEKLREMTQARAALQADLNKQA